MVCLLDLDVFRSALPRTTAAKWSGLRRTRTSKTLERLARAAVEQTSPEALIRLDAAVHRVWTPFQSLEINNTLVARKESEVSDVRQIAQGRLSAGALGTRAGGNGAGRRRGPHR